jgi:hypothetical protein
MFGLMSRILDEIRKAIKASGRSRYSLSKDAFIPQSQLSRLMKREKALSIESLERLINVWALKSLSGPKRHRNGR